MVFAALGRLGQLLAPSVPNGEVPVLVPLARRVHRAVRETEILFRQILIAEAEKHVERLFPARGRRSNGLSQTPLDTTTKAEGTAAPEGATHQKHGRARRAPNPFFFPLKMKDTDLSAEFAATPLRTATPLLSRSDRGLPPRPNTYSDLSGTRHVSVAGPYKRYLALVVAIEHPARPIHRMALLLRRRRLKAQSDSGGDGDAAPTAGSPSWQHAGVPDHADILHQHPHDQSACTARTRPAPRARPPPWP